MTKEVEKTLITAELSDPLGVPMLVSLGQVRRILPGPTPVTSPVTSERQLLSINVHPRAATSWFISHHGRMHAQPELGQRPAAGAECQAAPTGGYRTEGGLRASVRSRHSALSSAQRLAWERRWPELGKPQTGQPQPGDEGPLDIGHWFGRDAPVVLEIGCGSGTSTLAMAQQEPQINVIAVELYRRGLAQLLCAIDRAKVNNIRLMHAEAAEVIAFLIPSGALAGVRVFFPDPWPKARHHKRRFLQPRTIALIADRLQPGGVLHVATDHADYAEQIAQAGDAEAQLRRADISEPLPITVQRPATKYETKAQYAGSAVTELLWTRR